MNLTCTTIKKSIFLLIALVSVIALTLSNSFAVNNITSPMSEPQLSYNNGNMDCYVYSYREDSPLTHPQYYSLFVLNITSSSNCKYYWVRGISSEIHTTEPCSVTIYNYNPVTGYLITEKTLESTDRWNHTHNGIYYPYTLYMGFVPNSTVGYYVVPENENVFLTGSNPEPFITWSVVPPEHNQYHSHLSEPVADKYNRFFIIDDKLYWISFRINGAYVLTSDIMTEQEVESYTSTGEYIGAISSGSNSLVSIGSQTTYKDMEVFPVNFKSEQFFDDQLLYLSLYYTSSGVDLRINIDRLGLIRALSTDRLYVETELYYSVFNLEDGSYVESKFFENEGFVTSNLSLNADLPETISDIKCYGVAFINADNLPVNLSDVLWEYDLEFAEWRDRLETMLERIYQSLTGETVETETYTQPSWNDELNQAEPISYISQDEMISVFDGGFENVRPSPEDQLSITSWVDMFSISKLIAACCFALAMGTIILTLGKKKSD